MDDTKVRPPRFNHVAMSVPSTLLEPAGREELTAFYADVFGWQELPTEPVDGQKLVFGVHTVEQFVFLIADDPPMTCPRLDHYGLSVETEPELDAVLAKAKAWQARDDRVDIVDKKTDDHGMLAITSIYVRYLLPMMVEIQWWDWKGSRCAAITRCATARSCRRAGSSSTRVGARPTRGRARWSSRSSPNARATTTFVCTSPSRR